MLTNLHLGRARSFMRHQSGSRDSGLDQSLPKWLSLLAGKLVLPISWLGAQPGLWAGGQVPPHWASPWAPGSLGTFTAGLAGWVLRGRVPGGPGGCCTSFLTWPQKSSNITCTVTDPPGPQGWEHDRISQCHMGEHVERQVLEWSPLK